MIKVKTKVGDVIMCMFPNETYSVETFDKDDCRIRFINCAEINNITYNNLQLIGKISELDKELEEFVDWSVFDEPIKLYVNYIDDNPWFKTPKQSFISLIKSQHPEFQENKDYLLIKLL